jgi:DNA-binding XRE family transcriptional regulator
MAVGRVHIWLPKQAIDTVGVMPAWSTPAWKEENRHLATLLGAKLRAARHTAKISQERLAQVARLHRTEMGAVERGTQVPSLQTLLICADALDLDPGGWLPLGLSGIVVTSSLGRRRIHPHGALGERNQA